MLKEDFTNGGSQNQQADKPQLAELEQKYSKELQEYEEKTHFMQEHESDFGSEDAPGFEMSGNSSSKGKSNEQFSSSSSVNGQQQEKGGKQHETSGEKEESFGEVVLATANQLIGKGAEAAGEKAGEIWDNVKSEWKENRRGLVKKTLVGAAVTGAAVGLLLLSTRKKKTTLAGKLAAAM